jgi:hypothetical protein
MPESNVERMRHAIAKVEVLLEELEPPAAVEVLTVLPASPVSGSSAAEGFVPDRAPHQGDIRAGVAAPASAPMARDAQTHARVAESRAETAGEIERLLVEARRVARRLRADEQRTAAAMLVEAERVAQRLQADERRAADAILSKAEHAAQQLHNYQAQAAGMLLIEAERSASARVG